jgi:protein transport protein SEC24
MRGVISLKAVKSLFAIFVGVLQMVSQTYRLICTVLLTVVNTSVSAEYFSHLDMSSRRMDLENRPELRFGSVDFVVGKDYWVQDKLLNQSPPMEVPRQPVPLNYIFAIDVSWTSGRCRLVHEVIAGLKELLYPSQASNGSSTEQNENASCGLPPGSKVAIMTFDRTVHFFNLKVGLTKARKR